MEKGDRDANGSEQRIYPVEVIRNGGMTYIPNMIFRKEMELKYSDKVYLCYLLSKPIDWIYYYSKIAEETGISKSTIYQVNERLNDYLTLYPKYTGKYGSGFKVNFSKLYGRCIEIGAKLIVEKQKMDKDKQKMEHLVQNSEIDFQILEESVRKVATTNTDINTKDNNTNLSIESEGSQTFHGKFFEEGDSPCGECPENETNSTNESDMPDNQKTNTTRIPESKERIIPYIFDKMFPKCHYTKIKKDELKNKLFDLPLVDLLLLVKYSSMWDFWCDNISPELGLTKVKGSDHGLALMLNDSIYQKYINYIRGLDAENMIKTEKDRLLREKEKQLEDEKTTQLNQEKIIEKMPYENKLKTLRSFRFDKLKDFGKINIDEDLYLETIATDNSIPWHENDSLLYDILLHHYDDNMYQGMDEVRKWKDSLSKYNVDDIESVLKNFNFNMLNPPIKYSQLYFRRYAENKNINGDQEILYNILEHNYPDNYYKGQDIPDDFEESLMASLEDDD
jgi:hypothetical protein